MSKFKFTSISAMVEALIEALSAQYKHDSIRVCRTGSQLELQAAESSTQTFNRDSAAFARMALIRKISEEFDLELLEESFECGTLIDNSYNKEWSQ